MRADLTSALIIVDRVPRTVDRELDHEAHEALALRGYSSIISKASSRSTSPGSARASSYSRSSTSISCVLHARSIAAGSEPGSEIVNARARAAGLGEQLAGDLVHVADEHARGHAQVADVGLMQGERADPQLLRFRSGRSSCRGYRPRRASASCAASTVSPANTSNSANARRRASATSRIHRARPRSNFAAANT